MRALATMSRRTFYVTLPRLGSCKRARMYGRPRGYLGMTIEMLSQRYGHHHPDHLSGAKRAFAN